MKRRVFIQSAVATAAAISVPRTPAFAIAPRRVGPRILADLEAVTGDGARVTLTAAALEDLKGRLRGKLLLSGDEGYDRARQILNPSFDRRPALIVQPTGVADIRAAVNFARENKGLLLAVKCGGHSASGQSTCDRGMQIDLSHFRDVRVDPVARRAWVTGGSLLGQLDHEAMSMGLATPMGTVSHTGVGGLVTGGGFGRLARRFGLSVDNLLSADVVTADGAMRHASAKENPDLFWGVRGGGGNFGIVTNFEFQLHPMQRQVVAGELVFPIARARDVFQVFAEYGPAVPDDFALGLVLVKPPGAAPGLVMFEVCHSGPANTAERALAPLRKLGTPLADTIKSKDYVAVQRSGDVSDPRAEASYLKSGFIANMPGGLISAILDRFEGHPQRSTAVFFQQGGGAIAKVPSTATAFAQRDVQANMLCAVGWKFGQDGSAHTQWIKQYWTGIEKFTHGFYVNDLESEHSAAAIRDNYRRNHDRLVAVKTTYDPGNLFRMNANVKPAAKKA
ncbi:MAG: FAD-binding oxidoreductase [Cytophagaceae bacterium]|nr:FAD-binding oxidoreductase [Gemmatimonadaceae bacterium]